MRCIFTKHEGRLMKHMRNTWVLLVSNLIWLSEKVFFYPKLKSAYFEMNLLKTFQKRELVVFDVGANKGQSIIFFKSIFPNVRIYAFEPSGRTFQKLKKVASKIGEEDVELFQIGIGKLDTTLNFYESILSETSTFALPNEKSVYLKKKNRILFQKKNAFTETLAKLVTFDSFFRDHGLEFVDVLKIDVEGFEFEVLQGASASLIAKKIGVIQFERHVDDMRTDNSASIEEFLENNGYVKVYEIKHPFGEFFEVLYKRS